MGQKYDWGSMKVFLNGVEIAGVTAVSPKDTLIGINDVISYSGTITMYKSEIDKLLRAAGIFKSPRRHVNRIPGNRVIKRRKGSLIKYHFDPEPKKEYPLIYQYFNGN